MGEPYKRFAVKKLKRPAGGELQCVPREAARRDEDAAVGTLGRHDPEQLSDALDGDLAIEPVLALHNHPLRAADNLQVDTAIGLTTAAFPHRIALLAEGLTDQEFKVRPAHLPERTNAGCPREE
jgi:hypothetical protein